MTLSVSITGRAELGRERRCAALGRRGVRLRSCRARLAARPDGTVRGARGPYHSASIRPPGIGAAQRSRIRLFLDPTSITSSDANQQRDRDRGA